MTEIDCGPDSIHPLISSKDLSENAFPFMERWREEWKEEASPHAYKPLRTPNGPPRFRLTPLSVDDTPESNCGAENQTVHEIVTEWPRRAYFGRITDFLVATHSAIEYITYI